MKNIMVRFYQFESYDAVQNCNEIGMNLVTSFYDSIDKSLYNTCNFSSLDTQFSFQGELIKGYTNFVHKLRHEYGVENMEHLIKSVDLQAPNPGCIVAMVLGDVYINQLRYPFTETIVFEKLTYETFGVTHDMKRIDNN